MSSETSHKATAESPWANLKYDGPAGIAVFLVALPLCLGIALASGAPLFAGVLAGIVGGLVVGVLSGSQLSVSGPAAGLAVIVFGGIQDIGSYRGFLLAVVLSGVIQLVLGLLRFGVIADYVPNSVIKGMLAGIGSRTRSQVWRVATGDGSSARRPLPFGRIAGSPRSAWTSPRSTIGPTILLPPAVARPRSLNRWGERFQPLNPPSHAVLRLLSLSTRSLTVGFVSLRCQS